MHRLALTGVILAALSPVAASAQPVLSPSDEQARALERQVQDALALFGGANASASNPVTLQPEGDHYLVSAPFGDAGRWTATATPRPGGRWAVDRVRFPSPATFTTVLPQAAVDRGPPGMAAQITTTVTFGQQMAQMLLDPTMTTPTTYTSTAQNVDVAISGGLGDQKSHIDSGAASMILTPAGDGLVNLLIESTLDNYAMGAETPNGTLATGAEHVRLTSSMEGVSRAKSVTLLQSVGTMMRLMRNGKPADDPDAAALTHAAESTLDTLNGLAHAFAFDESIDNLTANLAGMQGSLKTLRIGLSARNDNDRVGAKLDLGAAGLVLPELGLGSKAELIPSKLTMRPTVSGVPAAALSALLEKAKANQSPEPEDIAALFAGGGILAGLEDAALDVAGAQFNGHVMLTFVTPQQFSGTGQITATNLDALQTKLTDDPELAQAVPVIIFMKGIGRAVDNRIVWDLAYRGGRLFVNNQDLSALTGMKPGPGGDAPASRPAPVPGQGQGRLRRSP